MGIDSCTGNCGHIHVHEHTSPPPSCVRTSDNHDQHGVEGKASVNVLWGLSPIPTTWVASWLCNPSPTLQGLHHISVFQPTPVPAIGVVLAHPCPCGPQPACNQGAPATMTRGAQRTHILKVKLSSAPAQGHMPVRMRARTMCRSLCTTTTAHLVCHRGQQAA